ncbi:MAG: hypothetical protein CMO44_10985 [Verrucomicrobiales bacterium]|nr:hypothetical protein [Verrucomicrobiales bacterium]|tara:strand:- start:3906 stop:4463 length:558 start_codon:yes stop_codon:yes gene_type:complete
MAGTLSVQKIQGLASATDPTTVTIPSGHKLVASDTAGVICPGQILQVVNTNFASNTGPFNTSANSYVQITGLDTTITPKASGSHILCTVNVMHGQNSNGWMHGELRRDGTQVAEQSWYGKDQYGGGIDCKPWFNFVDTTSGTTAGTAIAYTVWIHTQGSTTVTVNWNNNNSNLSTSNVTLMEIAQ